MINKTNCLRFRKGGIDRSLYTIEWSDYVWNGYQAGIGFQLNGKNFYVPAKEGIASNTICFQKNGKNYYCFNDYPRLTFYFSHSPVKDQYDNIIAYTKKLTEVRLSYAIKTALDIFINNGNGWEKVGTIKAGQVQIKPDYSVTASMTYSQAHPWHIINLLALTQQGVKTITGSVTWTVDSINLGTGKNITASVKLNQSIDKGYIDVTGHWYGYIPYPPLFIPIWSETTGTSTVMSSPSSEGSATRWFANVNCSKFRMRLVYHSNNSEFGDRTICDRSWDVGNPNQFANALKSFPITDALSFETLGEDREVVVVGSVGMTDTERTYDIPSKWY